jgi:hypothetical protein
MQKNNKKLWAGIGSRNTPLEILQIMTKIAEAFAGIGYTLRSGGALGADSAFEKGADIKQGRKEIYVSKDATPEANELAMKFHPNPEALKRKGSYVVGLMGRNMQIVSGRNLDDDVDFIVCWTKDGKASGGTGQALRYAMSKNIKVYNLYFEEHIQEIKRFYQEQKKLFTQSHI